jgi:hypothetical protein
LVFLSKEFTWNSFILKRRLAATTPTAQHKIARIKIGALISYGKGNRLTETAPRLTIQKIIRRIATAAIKKNFI